MKKKILILSLAVNLIVGAFVLYAFTTKAKNVNDGGNKYLIMKVFEGMEFRKISITDGSTISNIDLRPPGSRFGFEDRALENNQIITKKINDLKNEGYELAFTNGCAAYGGFTSYIFTKK